MSADSQGNDLQAVGVPITGLAAYAPLLLANIIARAAMGASPLVLPSAFQRLGLIKVDGGPAESREAGDALEFFQKGYTLAGDGTRSVQIGLAEQNPYVQALTEGREPDANGVIAVSSSLPDNRFILLVVTKYRNGRERRRQGVAAITAVEPDQQERGSVEGIKVTFTWQEDDLFDGAPFWNWGPATPGVTASKTAWNATITGTPTGGTYRLVLNGAPTANLAYNAVAADVAAALNALSGVTGLAGITVTGTGPMVVTLPSAGVLSATSALTGGTAPAVTVA